jgi:hypothetical protein
MKSLFPFLFLLAALSLTNIQQCFADRGALLDYELLEFFESEDVVDFFIGQFDNYIDPEDVPAFFELATAFFSQLIDQRHMSIYKMNYETVDFYGEYAEASGIILIPGHENFTCSKSFSIYAHGTVFDREAVNSRRSNWGGEFMLTLMMAAVNTICVAPDYYGLGDGDGFHHHNTYRTNVNSSIDALRAGRHLCDELGVEYNNRLLPMGYSEGGHASMGIARMVREEGLQDEFRIPFVGAGSGAYDMSGEAFDFIVGDPFYATPQYILYQAATCEDIYGNIIVEEEGETYSDFLQPPYDQLFQDHVLSQDGNMGWVVRPWTDMFRPEKVDEIVSDPSHPFRQCLANSNVFQWNNPYPTLMYYCTTDEQVPYTGALKTRDIQRSLIPWFLFWQRFKIQAIDLTLGELIPNHGVCALPSIFLQVALMDKSLGLQCTYTGREAGMEFRTSSGERVDQKIIYTPKSLDLNSLSARLGSAGRAFKSIRGMNLQTGNTLMAESGHAGLEIKENGFYILRLDMADGSEMLTWLYKADPDFVHTGDYDPILANPMADRTRLDLSLLTETVLEVAILDLDGREHFSVSPPEGAAFTELVRQPSMRDGTYMVEVRTVNGNYPLKLGVDSRLAVPELLVFPNPAGDRVTIDLVDCGDQKLPVEVYNAQGRLIISEMADAAGCSLQMDTGNLPAGVYSVRIITDRYQSTGTFIKGR